jgi:hypothetical protein
MARPPAPPDPEQRPPEGVGGSGTPSGEPERGITRQDLELVVRRAAELYTRETDADDHLTEAEVLRIAEELGLPGRHVRQALYELPATHHEEGAIHRWYGLPFVQGTRVVPVAPPTTMDRLEEYLVTREYLQVLRRQGYRAAFAPADDAISNVARAVRRPAGQWQVARSRRVLVEVRPMPDDESHVRIELDFARQRGRALRTGIAGGLALGLPLAALVGLPVGAVILDLAGAAAASAAAVSTGIATLGGSVAAGLAMGRSRFRRRVDNARIEIAALLDRLEAGGMLDPPPAPWLRGLRSRFTDTWRGTTRGSGPAA